jgi:single-stranded DNA-binding protein
MFDDAAKAALPELRKGSEVFLVGNLIHNKWVDKASGEERKQFRMRAGKLLSKEEFNSVQDIFETVDSSSKGKGAYSGDSGFASEPPSMDDQSSYSAGSGSGSGYGSGGGGGGGGGANSENGYQKPWVPVAGDKPWKKASPASPAPPTSPIAPTPVPESSYTYTKPPTPTPTAAAVAAPIAPAAPVAPVAPVAPAVPAPVVPVVSAVPSIPSVPTPTPPTPPTPTPAISESEGNSWDTVDDSMPWWDN